MSVNVIKFLYENQSPCISNLREGMKDSLTKGDLLTFNKYWIELKGHFYNIINSSDGEVIL